MMDGINKESKFTQKAFNSFHRDNPSVYKSFVRFALEAARRRPYFSARAIIQRMRWETMIEENSKSTFKLSNNWVAYYARKFMKDYPQHEGFFRTRTYNGGVHDHGGEE